MSIILTYFPDKGVAINDTILDWGVDRQLSRRLLGNTFIESNEFVDLSEYHDGSTNFNIIQRRDIYQNYQTENNYFFLNYDKDDCLNEVEIHNGFAILVNKIKLNFELDFQEAVSKLKTISSENKMVSEGEFISQDLKLSILDRESMGGTGSLLSYFYCSKNINHLISG